VCSTYLPEVEETKEFELKEHVGQSQYYLPTFNCKVRTGRKKEKSEYSTYPQEVKEAKDC